MKLRPRHRKAPPPELTELPRRFVPRGGMSIDPDEIIVDLFAGGGGASLGIEMALGRKVDVAINHDRDAVAMHKANHPETEHHIEDIADVDPLVVCRGRRVGLLWASPDCTDHSRAKNGAIVRDRKVRALANIVIAWAAAVRPRVIMLENVQEWWDWGPLDENGKIDKDRKGESRALWWSRLEALGYKISMRILRASDYGVPTSRTRLFIIARCDGLDPEMDWPDATHGPGRESPYRTAAECIDYSLPCPSVFMTHEEARAFTKATGIKCKRPLADKTMQRIRRGLFKYVLNAAKPFTIRLTGDDPRVHDIDEPMRTVTAANRGELGFVTPLVTPVKTWGGGGNEAAPADRPLRTVTTSDRGEYAVVQPHLVSYYGDGEGGLDRASGLDEPVPTVTTANRFAVVTPFVAQTAYGEGKGKTRRRGLGAHGPEEPLPTVTAHSTGYAVVAPTLIQTGYGERPGQAPRCLNIKAPLGTVISGGGGNGNGKHAVVQTRMERVASFIYKGYGGDDSPKRTGGFPGAADAGKPLSTVTCKDHNGVVVSHLVKMRGTSESHMESSAMPAETPVPTISAQGNHVGEVRAFLTRYNGTGEGQLLDESLGTVTTHDRFGIVMIEGVAHQIIDIGMRMLEPRELYRAQGFPDWYIIDPIVETTRTTRKGRKITKIGPLSKTGQVEKCGNSVCPPLACALVMSVFSRQRAAVAA